MVKSLVLVSEKRCILRYWQPGIAEIEFLCSWLLYFSSFWWWIIFVSVSSCQCVELWIVYFVRIFSLQHTYFCVVWVVEHTYFCVMRFLKQGNVVFERENFASYKECILLLIKEGILLFIWRRFRCLYCGGKSTKVVKMPKQMHHFVEVIDRRIASSRLSYICYLENCCDRQSHLSHFSCEKAWHRSHYDRIFLHPCRKSLHHGRHND